MSQWNDPGKVEEALATVTAGLTLDVYDGDTGDSVTVATGMDDGNADLPLITHALTNGAGPEVVKGTGIHRSNAVIRVTSSANITLAEHRTRSATVFDAFLSSTIKETLSAAIDDFHVYEFSYQSPEPTRKDPRGEDAFVWVSELPVEIVWCGSTIA